MNLGQYVKININYLENTNWPSLDYGSNCEGKDYINYIIENSNKIYKIIKILSDTKNIYYDAHYVIDDSYLKTTSFSAEELTIIK